MSGRPVLAARAREKVLFPDPASPVTSIRQPTTEDGSRTIQYPPGTPEGEKVFSPMGGPLENTGSSTRPRVTRRVVFAFSLLSWLGIFGLVPWLVGSTGRKVGWRLGRPAAVNRVGLVALGAGASGLGWCLTAHYDPGEKVAVSLVPDTLIAKGPYRFSRNPMYVCEQALLLGWAVYFGSPGLVVGMSVLAGAMRYAVAREERTLEGRFGESWREYAAKVPRWV